MNLYFLWIDWLWFFIVFFISVTSYHTKLLLQVFALFLFDKLSVISLPILNQFFSCTFDLTPILLLILFHDSKLNRLFYLFYNLHRFSRTILSRLNNRYLLTDFINVNLPPWWYFFLFHFLLLLYKFNAFLDLWLQVPQPQSVKFFVELFLVLIF